MLRKRHIHDIINVSEVIYMENIGERIKRLRSKKNMTLEELGNQVGVGKSTVRKWETGMIANMRRDKIAKLADALDVSPAYLMGWKDNSTEAKMSDDFYKKIFSKNLRYYMDLNQKEQIDIINDLGFNKSSVSTWCNGTRLPRMDKVDALAKYFGINRSDLIVERKNNTSISSFIQCQTKDEETLVLSYRELNNINKKKCMVYSKNLLSTQRMENELLAAHQRTDIEVTPEGIQNDLDIMNDDNLWK